MERNTKNILDKVEQLGKRDENLSRARRTIRNLIWCNKFDYFCTFTFDSFKVDRYNFDACKRKLMKLFNNYKTRYAPDFRYIAIPEFHEDGAIHFHGMFAGIRHCDFVVNPMIPKRDKATDELKYVPNTPRYVTWSKYTLGHFSCSTPKDYEACGNYIAKYITKEMANMPKGRRLVFHSRNLRPPELIFDQDDLPLIFQPDFRNEFVAIKDTPEMYGVLPEWWNEAGADEYGDEQAEEELFDRLTGEQLKMYTGRVS